MYYKKTVEGKLDKSLFENPTSEYRACPFWAWNTTLKQELLEDQIMAFRDMGFGGFFMHSRIGLQTEYLGTEFFEAVRKSIDIAKKQHMQAWIYDEDRYPSGFAGGLVTKDCQYRYKYLVFSQVIPEEIGTIEEVLSEGKPHLLAIYDVNLSENGMLLGYERISCKEEAKEQCWYAYLAVHQPNWWYNGQTYIDTLSPEPMKKFLETTHEKYKENFEACFGNVVPGVFTDEPQPLPDVIQSGPLSGEAVTFSWTVGLEEQFEKENGFSLLDVLPELVWELPKGKLSKARYFYRKIVSDKFYEGFFVPYAEWCKQNNLLFTGHLQDENTLIGQTKIMGEAMRCYRAFEMPGIDLLCDNIELCTVKQAQSVAHQEGQEGVASELYGATNWDFDFRKHKFQGDWQAALGVTLRVPHLAWLSMEGPAKRDYPASISVQSPWYREYAFLEDHYARINTALTRGKAVVKVGVIHPIESLWLVFGNKQDTGEKVDLMQYKFEELTQWLLYGKQDFDFISEALLPEQFIKADDKKLFVGHMSYEVIIVSSCITLRKTTVDILKEYVAAGGKVIFVDHIPDYRDAVQTEEIQKCFSDMIVIPHKENLLLQSLEEHRIVEIVRENGSLDRDRFYQLRQDGDDMWLFIAQGKKNMRADCVHEQQVTIRLKGEYRPIWYDTLSGEIRTLEYRLIDEFTEIPYCFYHYDSLLLKLVQTDEHIWDYGQEKTFMCHKENMDFPESVEYQREEDNVYLLDLAEWKLDDGEWHKLEEVLKIDRQCRELLDYPLKGTVQPWTLPVEKTTHYVWLKFVIPSEIAIDNVELGYEEVQSVKWNGQHIECNVKGFYVDRAIRRVNLSDVVVGDNILEVQVPITSCRGPESLYLLGDFDVRVRGMEKVIVAPNKQIKFGDVVSQGLPFYGGNLRYVYEFFVEKSSIKLCVPSYRGSVVKIFLDGEFMGYIAFEPYEVVVEHLDEGLHTVEIVLCGNRVNTFGCLHNADTSITRFGPPAWQTEGDAWSYEYRFWKNGVMSAPRIEVYTD